MSSRSAVIVGATRNLGLHLALHLRAQGWSVVGVGRTKGEADSHANGVHFEQLDLARAESGSKLAILLRDVSPDLIVYNAVSYGPQHSIPADLGELESMFRVNALVPYLALSSYFENHLEAAKTSCVLINSDSIFHANKQVGCYAASKAALKVMGSALSDICRSKGGATATLLLGPLADEAKLEACTRIAERTGAPREDVIRKLLQRSNPFFLRDTFISFEEPCRSIEYIYSLGRAANGMVCKLDGGASGSLC